MLTFNVLFKIHGKKKHITYLKSQIFLFFSEALSMLNQITNKNT